MDKTVHTELLELSLFAAPPMAVAPGQAADFDELYLLAPLGHFVLAADSAILHMNVVGADLLGLPRENPGRATLRQFVAPRFHPDFDRMLRDAAQGLGIERCDLQMQRHRGQQGFPVSLRASADGHGIRVVLEPAEGRLAALERSEERLRRMVHQAEEGIWEIDGAARTSFVNPRMAQMLGYAIEEMLEQPLVAFMDDEGRAILEQHIAQRRQDAAERHEFKFIRKDGGALWVTLATRPIQAGDGSYRGALALVSDITAGRASAERIWQQANFDALTALPNRHMLLDRLNQQLKQTRRSGLQLALLVIGLDGVRADDGADAVLVEAARRIDRCVRGADTVSHLGGGEFVIVLGGLEQADGAERIARQLLAALARPLAPDIGPAALSASIGLALHPDDADDADALLAGAMQAMRAAGADGGNRYRYAGHALQVAAQARQLAARDLRMALRLEQLELHYQPIVNLRSGKIERAEALLRWRHPQHGLLAPADFLPLAEAGGLMLELGDWVFRQAARQARQWQDELGEGFQVSIHQSATQLRGDTALYVDWLRHAASLGLAPRSMVLEIAEEVLMARRSPAAERLRDLREMGLQVALDNFGSGHASLSHLRQAGIDLLKLDRGMIGPLAHDSGELALCEALIAMAHKLGLRVVAEGVESAAQGGLLAMAGCDYAQGYAYAGAMPAGELSVLARRGLALAD